MMGWTASSLLTAEEVAEHFRLPRSTIYAYTRRETNPLPAIRVGRHLRYVAGDLEAWIGAQRREANHA